MSTHVRYTEEHQALMVLRRFECRAALFDGLSDEGIEDSADKVLERMVELLKDVEPEFFG